MVNVTYRLHEESSMTNGADCLLMSTGGFGVEEKTVPCELTCVSRQLCRVDFI